MSVCLTSVVTAATTMNIQISAAESATDDYGSRGTNLFYYVGLSLSFDSVSILITLYFNMLVLFMSR